MNRQRKRNHASTSTIWRCSITSRGLRFPPFTPTHGADYRFPARDNQLFVDLDVKALELRHIAEEVGALFAGKVPLSYLPGGVTQAPNNTSVNAFMPASGSGEGFTEATRGGLGRWLQNAGGKLTC